MPPLNLNQVMDDIDPSDLKRNRSRLKSLANQPSSSKKTGSRQDKSVTDLLGKLRLEHHRHEINVANKSGAGRSDYKGKGKAIYEQVQADVLLGSLEVPTLSISAIGPSATRSLGPSGRRTPGPAAPSSWRSSPQPTASKASRPKPPRIDTDLVCEIWRAQVLPVYLPPQLLPPTSLSKGSPTLVLHALKIVAAHLAPTDANGWDFRECLWLHKEVRRLRREWRVAVMVQVGLVGELRGLDLDGLRGVWDGDTPREPKKQEEHHDAGNEDEENEYADWDRSESSYHSESDEEEDISRTPSARLPILDISLHTFPPVRSSVQSQPTWHTALRSLLQPLPYPTTPLRSLSLAGAQGITLIQAIRSIPEELGKGLRHLSLAGLGGADGGIPWGEATRGLRAISRWGEALEVLDLSYIDLHDQDRITVQFGDALRLLFEGHTSQSTTSNSRLVSTTYHTTPSMPALGLLGMRGWIPFDETDEEGLEAEDLERVTKRAVKARTESGGKWVDVVLE